MEAVHSGVKGDVIDGSTGQPVQNAKVGKFNYSIGMHRPLALPKLADPTFLAFHCTSKTQVLGT